MSYDYSENEELTLLRQTVRSFAEKEIAPRAHQLDVKEEFSYELTEKLEP
jgi:alkylation response protein AidB-like acyl-CoA dehydrogenase